MATTHSAAVDELYTSVKAAFDASTPLIGYIPEVRWPGAPKGTKPDKTKYWARVSQQLVTEDQASLSNVDGVTLWEAAGLLYVQLFCPRNAANSIDKGRQLADAVRDVFRAQSITTELWYRNQKVVELPETPENYPINVVIEFRYKTFRNATAPVIGGGTIEMPSKVYHKIAAAGLNIASIKATSGVVTGWKIYNNTGYPIFVKLYDKVVVPVVGTDTPAQTIGVDAGQGDNIMGMGYTYVNGIGFAITKLISDGDATPVVAGDCSVDVFYQ